MNLSTIQLRVGIEERAAREVKEYLVTEGKTKITGLSDEAAKNFFYQARNNTFGSLVDVMEESCGCYEDTDFGLLLMNTVFQNNREDLLNLLAWINENAVFGENYHGSFIGTIVNNDNEVYLIKNNDGKFVCSKAK